MSNAPPSPPTGREEAPLASGAAPPPAAQTRKKGLGPLGRLLVKLAAVVAIFAVMFTVVMGLHIQRGNRMHPYIMDGDLVVTYKLEGYRVGDVVAYRNPQTGQSALSRIVAIGPCTVQVTDNGQLLVNGASPSESVFYPTKPLPDAPLQYPLVLTGGQCFVLDDYRTIGSDSRAFGPLALNTLRGKAVYVFRRRGI